MLNLSLRRSLLSQRLYRLEYTALTRKLYNGYAYMDYTYYIIFIVIAD